jgi:hypothetical protein
MKTLKTQFSKNGLDYTLMKCTYKVALFLLGPSSDPDGYEVCRIYIMRLHKAFGIDFEESEVISTNNQFFTDGSGALKSLDNALKHYNKLSKKICTYSDVESENTFNTELILECQAV